METYLSNVQFIMPQTKKEAQDLAPKMVAELNTNPQSIVDFFAMLKHFNLLMDLVKKDDSVLRTFLDAIENGIIENSALGCEVKTFSRTSYDFSDNSEWVEMNKKEDELKAKKKEIENRLKSEIKNSGAGMSTVDDETGEILGKAKIKEITRYFKTNYKL